MSIAGAIFSAHLYLFLRWAQLKYKKDEEAVPSIKQVLPALWKHKRGLSH